MGGVPIVYVDRSAIREGALEDLKKGMHDLVDFVAANEPQIISYSVYFDEARGEMTVIHVHTDTSSLAFHMDVAGPEFPKVADFITLQSIDLYGPVDDELIAKIRAKAELLGTGTVRVHDVHAGFVRPRS